MMPTPGDVSLFRSGPRVTSVLDCSQGFGRVIRGFGRNHAARNPAEGRPAARRGGHGSLAPAPNLFDKRQFEAQGPSLA